MVSNVPGTVIRSPTDSSGPRVLSKARSLLVVIGSVLMNACTFTRDHVSSDTLVTQPLTRIFPLWGIEDGVSVSMVSDNGASSSRRDAARAAAAGLVPDPPAARARAWVAAWCQARVAVPADGSAWTGATGAANSAIDATAARAGSSVERRSTARL